jgi:hypothetical protein
LDLRGRFFWIEKLSRCEGVHTIPKRRECSHHPSGRPAHTYSCVRSLIFCLPSSSFCCYSFLRRAMVVSTETCFFTELKVYPGHGKRFVRKDDRVSLSALPCFLCSCIVWLGVSAINSDPSSVVGLHRHMLFFIIIIICFIVMFFRIIPSFGLFLLLTFRLPLISILLCLF